MPFSDVNIKLLHLVSERLCVQRSIVVGFRWFTFAIINYLVQSRNHLKYEQTQKQTYSNLNGQFL